MTFLHFSAVSVLSGATTKRDFSSESSVLGECPTHTGMNKKHSFPVEPAETDSLTSKESKFLHMSGRRLRPGEWGNISVRQISPTRWEADCRVRRENGHVDRIRRRGATPGAAEQAVLSEVASEVDAPPANTEELLERWLTLHARRGTITEKTRHVYEGQIDRYLIPHLGELRLEELTAPKIQRAIDTVHEEVSRDAATHARRRIKQALGWAVTVGVLSQNFAATVEVRGEGPHRAVSAPSTKQVHLLRDALVAQRGPDATGRKRIGPLIVFEILAATGARIGEVCALTWEDVDLSKGTVTFTDTVVEEQGDFTLRGHLKNGDQRRTNFLPRRLLGTLRAFPNQHGPVAAARGGGMMRPSNIVTAWRGDYDAVGVPKEDRLHPHALRTYVGTRIARTLGIEAAANQLGTTVEIVSRFYVEKSYEGPAEAAKILGDDA